MCADLDAAEAASLSVMTAQPMLPNPDDDLSTTDVPRIHATLLREICSRTSAFIDSRWYKVTCGVMPRSQLVAISTTGVVLCSCMMLQRDGRLCRHVMACIGPEVSARTAGVSAYTEERVKQAHKDIALQLMQNTTGSPTPLL